MFKRLLLVLLIIAGAVGVQKTDHLQRLSGTGDMRNRVVGARLMKDGILPYYYHWRPGDPFRYVIDRKVDTSYRRRVNAVTASPSFLRAIGPVADYSQSAIDRGFFLFFCGLLVVIAGIVWYQSKHLLWTLIFFVPFLFTDGWWHHITLGQYYFLFGFLFFITGYLLWKEHWIAAGICFALLIILRLNTLVFLVPFVFYCKQYKTFLSTTAACVLLYATTISLLPFERSAWMQYFASLKESTAIHLEQAVPEQPTLKLDSILPVHFEGEDIVELGKKRDAEHLRVNPEGTNLALIIKKISGRMPPLRPLQISFLATIIVIMTFLYRKTRRDTARNNTVEPLILTGLLFYFLSNFFSPIHINPYHMPQWMAVAGVMVIFRKKIPVVIWILFLAGLICNLRYMPDFKGKHVLSELLFLSSTFMAVIKGKWINEDKTRILSAEQTHSH